MEVLIDANAIRERVSALGKEISRAHQGEELVVVGVLTGCFVFMADLVRAIDVPVQCAFLGLSSYGAETESSGVVEITKDLTFPIAQRPVLVVEDIVDTGLTMAYLLDNLKTRQPASLQVATLLSKPARRRVQVPVDYVGFTIEDHFVVGYGMDHGGRHRELPHIAVLEELT
ncbi:MAG: hypoxanthine phosphoribosyltransferase [Myxococcota bacterium]